MRKGSGEREGGRQRSDQSVVIAVHVQPRAARTEIVGMHGDAVKIRLKAPPVDGAANDELVRLLAARLGIGRRDVDIVGGGTTRSKWVRVRTPLSAGEIVRRLCPGGTT